MMANTTENPNEETIKCVVVGDNNVGKTRLICARAYKHQYNTSRWRSCSGHVPTIWAIDQYRSNQEVLENARSLIDGTAVSIRLWDTFGDHHKNRIFAYGKADVVMICFSICDENSLRHVVRFWYPEVRKHCKNIPIILVGCKADLRFADLVKLNKNKNCLSRTIRYSDILFPDKCRNVALELNCLYYETSVVLGYGVQEVFENVCRAALIFRKTLSFWNSRLKKIARPSLQRPLQPPMPDPPKRNSQVVLSAVLPKLVELYQHEVLTDVTFVCQGRKLSAHKAILCASSYVFLQLFRNDGDFQRDSSNEDDCVVTLTDNFPCTNTSQTLEQKIIPLKELNVNNTNLLSGKKDCVSNTEKSLKNEKKQLSKPISFCGRDNRGNAVYSVDMQLVAFQLLLDFCYTGTIEVNDNSSNFSRDTLLELLDVCQSFEIPYLDEIINTLLGDKQGHSNLKSQEFINDRSQNIKKLLLDQLLFADVQFQVDDGCIYGHKFLLSSGCDMMYAMLAGRFVESGNKQGQLGSTVEDEKQKDKAKNETQIKK